MEKKQIIYNFGVVLPTVLLALYFGLVFASHSLSQGVDQGYWYLDDFSKDELLTAYGYSDWFDEEYDNDPGTTRRLLTKYLSTFFKTAGRSDLVQALSLDEFEWCDAITPRKGHRRSSRSHLRRRGRRAPARIRPERAHKLWKRLQKKKIFRWPVNPERFWISSYFGPRTLKGKKGFHQGLDMAASTGTPVIAAASGRVLESKYSPGYGNYILISHGNGYKTRYAHLSRRRAKPGQRVRAGQLIGKVGATGKVAKNKSSKSASHLHFEVYCNNKRINPLSVLA